VRGLTAKNCDAAGRIAGLAESPLRNLKLENIHIEAHKDFVIENTVGLEFVNVNVNGKALKAASFEAVQRAER